MIELDNSGFVSNAIGLLHAIPMFHKQNGTLFLDNTNFQYKCDPDGGWHDFFSGEDFLVPWSGPKEQAGGQACARYSLQRVEELMSQTVQTKADLLDFIGIKQVRPLCWQPPEPQSTAPCLSSAGDHDVRRCVQAWRYRPWVQELIDEELDRLREHEHPTIAFHIRGGDVINEDKQQVGH